MLKSCMAPLALCLGVNTSVFVCHVHCLSFTVQSEAEDSDVRTEPCNRLVDINPMCLALPGQVGLKPAKERRGSDDSACPCQVRQVQHGVRHIYLTPLSLCLSLCLPLCAYLFLTLLLRHTYCMQILILIFEEIRLSHIGQYLFFYIST